MWHVSAVPLEWAINPNLRLSSADGLHFVLLIVAFRMSVQKCSKYISNWRPSVTRKQVTRNIFFLPNKLEPVVLCQVCLALSDISLCLFCSTGVIAKSMTFVKMTKLFPPYLSGSLYWINNNIYNFRSRKKCSGTSI